MEDDEFGDFADAIADNLPSGVAGLRAPIPLDVFGEQENLQEPETVALPGAAEPAPPAAQSAGAGEQQPHQFAKDEAVWYVSKDGDWIPSKARILFMFDHSGATL
jgi:hypothetical protein